MKKMLITLQAFAFTAMLPLYFVLELNHGTATLSPGETTPGDNRIQQIKVREKNENALADSKNQYAVTGDLKGIY